MPVILAIQGLQAFPLRTPHVADQEQKVQESVEDTEIEEIKRFFFEDIFQDVMFLYPVSDFPKEMFAFKYGQAKGYRAAKAERRAAV